MGSLSDPRGPLLDRIDIHLSIPAVGYGDRTGGSGGEPSATVRGRVEAARARQRARFRGLPGVRTNAQMSAREVRRWCRSEAAAEALLREAVARLGLSARAYHRVLKIARMVRECTSVTPQRLGQVLNGAMEKGRTEFDLPATGLSRLVSAGPCRRPSKRGP